MQKFKRIYFLAVVFISTAAVASFPSRTTTLDWPEKSEVLEYRSCGCADACWVVELKNKRSGELKLRFRCDCEKLLVFHASRKQEVVYAPSCKSFQTESKFQSILAEMRKLSNPEGQRRTRRH